MDDVKVATAWGVDEVVFAVVLETPALDDEQARRVRLLLLRKAVVPAHRIERPSAAQLDELE